MMQQWCLAVMVISIISNMADADQEGPREIVECRTDDSRVGLQMATDTASFSFRSPDLTCKLNLTVKGPRLRRPVYFENLPGWETNLTHWRGGKVLDHLTGAHRRVLLVEEGDVITCHARIHGRSNSSYLLIANFGAPMFEGCISSSAVRNDSQDIIAVLSCPAGSIGGPELNATMVANATRVKINPDIQQRFDEAGRAWMKSKSLTTAEFLIGISHCEGSSMASPSCRWSPDIVDPNIPWDCSGSAHGGPFLAVILSNATGSASACFRRISREEAAKLPVLLAVSAQVNSFLLPEMPESSSESMTKWVILMVVLLVAVTLLCVAGFIYKFRSGIRSLCQPVVLYFCSDSNGEPASSSDHEAANSRPLT